MRPRSNQCAAGFRRPNHLTGSYKSDLHEILELLEFISGAFTVLAVLSIIATHGFTLLGLFIVVGYLLFWEFVSAIFSTVRRKLPTPLRVIAQIIEELVGIFT